MSDDVNKGVNLYFYKKGCKNCEGCKNNQSEKLRSYFDWINSSSLFKNCGTRKDEDSVCFASAICVDWKWLENYLKEHEK